MTYVPPPTYTRPPATSGQPQARAQSPAPPKVRFQKPDDPPASERHPDKTTVALSLPPPEQLGIGSPAPPAADLDLNALNTRLDELGAESTEWRKTAGGYRFVCKLASADGNRTQKIEADGATRAEAARLLLAKAEKWARGE